jgi:hypothetical protein
LRRHMNPQTSNARQACLECRWHKVKCQPGDKGPGEACIRCHTNGFTCRYESRKRGRKPKSSAQSMMQAASRQRVEEAIAPLQFSSPFISQVVPPAVDPSTARPSLPPLMTDRSVQRMAWHTLIKEQAARGSVYTFLTSGNADIAAPEVPTAVNHSASSLSSFASPPTLRRLLRRLDSPREARWSWAWSLPYGRRSWWHTLSTIVILGSVSSRT